jgi:crotonobetainyl-CoA:carnitine CoA-transferase CaiB-like acyl-CoA transferase
MGLSIDVHLAGALDLPSALAGLRERGHSVQVAMVDGALVLPTAPLPSQWRDVRLKSEAGMLTVARRGAAVSVTVFDTADGALQALARTLAEALRAAP